MLAYDVRADRLDVAMRRPSIGGDDLTARRWVAVRRWLPAGSAGHDEL
jgi:hypothetical protein